MTDGQNASGQRHLQVVLYKTAIVYATFVV